MKDKIIVSDYFHEEAEEETLMHNSSNYTDLPHSQHSTSHSSGVGPATQHSIPTTGSGSSGRYNPYTTSQRVSHSLSSDNSNNSCLGLGYMPLNSTSDIGFNQYPPVVYGNNLLYKFDATDSDSSYSSDDPLLFNSQQLIIPEEEEEQQQQNHNNSTLSSFQMMTMSDRQSKLERLDACCVSEISTSSSERTESRSSPFTVQSIDPPIKSSSLFEMTYSSFSSSDTEGSFPPGGGKVLERVRSPKMGNSMTMKHSARTNHLPSLETIRKQVSCELNIHHRKMDQLEMFDTRPSLNIIMAGCCNSGKSQLKSLLSSVMEFESERILPTSESYPNLVFRPVYRNLDHGSKTHQVNQDESQISFYKWDENISRCSIMFQPPQPSRMVDSNNNNNATGSGGSSSVNEVISQRIIFTDMPGISMTEECPNYCKILSQLYVGMYVSEMDEKMIEYGFENIKSGGRIQQVMCHDIVVLTIPIEFTENELKVTKSIQQHLESRGIPYMVVATKCDLVENERRIEERRKEIANFLEMRSFDITTIGMSGKCKEGIEDFELVRSDLHKETMLVLRKLLLQYNKKRSFVSDFKMRHGGLSPMEYSIKMITLTLFHYWLILHKVIHWVVIGPGGDNIEEEDYQNHDRSEHEPIELPTTTTITDMDRKPIMTSFETRSDSFNSRREEEERKSQLNQELVHNYDRPITLPPPPSLPQQPTLPNYHNTTMRGPSTIPLLHTRQILRDPITQPIEMKENEIPFVSAEHSDGSESDHLEEEECIYYSNKPKTPIIAQQHSDGDIEEKDGECEEVADDNESGGCIEESNEEEEFEQDEGCSRYYLCSMRIFQCLVVSLLFVLVFQSFALFAFQHLSSV